eukprot:529083-Rhodomonas_salina.1
MATQGVTCPTCPPRIARDVLAFAMRALQLIRVSLATYGRWQCVFCNWYACCLRRIGVCSACFAAYTPSSR